MRRKAPVAVVGALVVLGACAEPASGISAPEHPSFRRVRVLVTEKDGTRAAVYDVADRELSAELGSAGDARSTSFDGALAFGEGTRPSIVLSGVAVVDHDDHVHVYKSRPAVVAEPGFVDASSRMLSRGGFLGVVARRATSDAPRVLLFREQSLRTAKRDVRELAGDAGDVAWVLPLSGERALVAARSGGPLLVASADSMAKTTISCAQPGLVATGARLAYLQCAGELVAIDLSGPEARELHRTALLAPPTGLEVHLRGTTVTIATADAVLGATATEPGMRALKPDVCLARRSPLDASNVFALAGGRLVWARDGRERSVPMPCVRGATDLALAPDHAFVVDGVVPKLVDVDLARGISREVPLPFTPGRLLVLGLDPDTVDVVEGAAHDGF